MTDTSTKAVKRLRTQLLAQAETALGMPIPMTGIAKVSQEAEAALESLTAERDALREALEAQPSVQEAAGVLKTHLDYYRECEREASNPSQKSIAEFQAKAVEAALNAVRALSNGGTEQ